MNVEATTTECPHCRRQTTASATRCEHCEKDLIVFPAQEGATPIHPQVIRDRIYLAVSLLWLLIAISDVVRAAQGLLNPGCAFSTVPTIWVSGALHAGIGVSALLHEEPFFFIAGGLCYLQVGVAAIGIPFVVYLNGFTGPSSLAVFSLAGLAGLAIVQAILISEAQD